MVLKGLSLLSLDPEKPQRDLMLFIETNRCLADAAYVVTGITIGRRRLIMYNFGKAAMTFLDLNTRQAYRVAATSHIKPAKDVTDLIGFWSQYADEDIFLIQEVVVPLKPEDLPGRPQRRITCPICGEDVLDGRDVNSKDGPICRACAGEAYYKALPLKRQIGPF
jgi:formylmethanofuran dehydrogenase subunit E